MKHRILNGLPGDHPWRGTVHWYDAIGSTNTEAKRMAAQGAPEGTVLIAGSQSAGRGRLGRSFQSPAGSGIYMSVILRPGCAPRELMHLTCAAAVAACDAVEQTLGFRPGIKWINDLVAQRRKLAGILTELSIDPKTGLVDHAIVGIGLNCTQQLRDLPPELRDIACSAAMVTGRPVPQPQLTAALICAFEEMARRLQSHRDQTMERYRRDCVTVGKPIRLIRGQEQQEAFAIGIDDEGALLVRYPDGSTAAINSGEASVRGLFGYH